MVWAQQNYHNTGNLSKTQEKKRKRKRFPNVFFKNEITELFDNIEDLKTMMASFLAFFCALRNSEVCKLKWQDIDLENKRLKVVDGKNHKDGFIPISSVCIPILRKWRQINSESEYFLSGEAKGLPFLSSHALLERFKVALSRANLDIPTEKNAGGNQQHQYKFHTLRHSRCTHLLNNGVPIQKVQHFMRHDKIETTMHYTWILDTELNKMVEKVDTSPMKMYQEIMPENNQFTQTQTIVQQEHSNPIEIAKRRLAFGEISPREFKRIVGVLQTPLSV
ncbi:tyrosine-type recombinase/integrase [Candidatus Woesearchaeota archaeon]|nr:tyrosine-type recombinase/integrase [Candidatus Woesearchaeota archaeon]